MVRIKLNMWLEIVTRAILWWLFLYYDEADPFIRHISPNEVWKYQYPATDSIVPARNLWLIIFFYPVIFLFAEYFITGKSDDHVPVLLGLTFAYGLNGFITSILKIMIGRPRPDFFYRCFPNGSGDNYTKCTGDRKSYLDGRKSFPSGHSSFAFTCMIFMTLYLARKFHFSDCTTRQAWKLCVCLVPLLVATGIAISRTCDYHHHYEDVIGGALLGTVISCICYRLYFPNTTEVVQDH